MNGWQRLALVLSAIYWLAAGGMIWLASDMDRHQIPGYGPDPSPTHYGETITIIALALYGVGAAIWWAFSGFGGSARDIG